MVHSQVETITPKIARDWLKKNLNRQRTICYRHVDFLAQEISNGNWRLNGDAFRFDEDGNLIDGQHRLLAVIKADCEIKSYVVRGIAQEAFTTIDTGRKIRSSGDHLSILGETNARNLSSALCVIIRLESGTMSEAGQLPVSKIVETLQRHPEIRNSVNFAGRKMIRKLIRPSNAIALHYQFANINKPLADFFFNVLETGVTLDGQRNAVTLLRETLFRLKLATKRVNLNRNYELAIAIKAWNALIKDQVPTKYVYDAEREKCFPVIETKVKKVLH